MCLIFGKVNGYFEEINGNKYLMLVPINESRENIKTYEGLWIKTGDLTRSRNKNLDYYDEEYIKIKFSSGDKLPLNKTIEILIMKIIVKSCFSWE